MCSVFVDVFGIVWCTSGSLTVHVKNVLLNVSVFFPIDDKSGNKFLASGGVCTDKSKGAAVCSKLKNDFGVSDEALFLTGGTCPAPDCGKNDRDGCLTDRCVWCGVTVKDTDSAATTTYKGTALGKCVPIAKDATKTCDAVKFDTMKDALNYNTGTHGEALISFCILIVVQSNLFINRMFWHS